MLALEVMRVNILINIFSFHFSYQLSWDLSKKKKTNVDTANMNLFYLCVVEILSWGIWHFWMISYQNLITEIE